MIAPGCPSSTIHGTVTAYTDHRCRCPQARARMNEANTARKETYPNLVDSTGTRRRLRALMVNCWPGHELARRLDVVPSQVQSWARGDRTWIQRTSAEKVAALYGELHTLAGWSALGGTRCSNRGWAGVEQWGGLDMDDPAVQPWPAETWDPVVVDRLMFGEARWHYVLLRERREAVRRLRATCSSNEIGRRLRMSQRQVLRDVAWLRRRGLLG